MSITREIDETQTLFTNESVHYSFTPCQPTPAQIYSV